MIHFYVHHPNGDYSNKALPLEKDDRNILLTLAEVINNLPKLVRFVKFKLFGPIANGQSN